MLAASQHSRGFAGVPPYVRLLLALCELPTLACLCWLPLVRIFSEIRITMLVCLAQHLFSDY